MIGNHVSIQTDQIDMRCPVSIGNHVIIGAGVKIITLSHNITHRNGNTKRMA